MIIDAIFLNWNQADLTISTIDSFNQVKKPSAQINIIVVDNCSDDNSLAILKKHFAGTSVTIISTDQNLGYAGGNNFGIIWSQQNHHPDYLLISNNDLTFDSNFLINLLKPFEENRLLALTGPKIYFSPGKEYHRDRYQQRDRGKVIWSAGGNFDWQNIIGSNRGIDEVDSGQFDQTLINPDFISGCCFLVSAIALKKIGLFNPKYFMYLEDVDLCHRLRLEKMQIAYIPSSVVWHINAGSSSVGSHLHDYFITRNRLHFGFKYSPLKTKFALFRESLRTLLVGAKWQKIGVLDFYLQRFGKGSWQ